MKKVDLIVLVALILAFFISMLIFIVQDRELSLLEEVESYRFWKPTSSWKGANYEVTIPNKEDPLEVCIPGESDVKILALEYFYITQEDEVLHGVAIENSYFEVEGKLSGCWEIGRETDEPFLIRVVTLSGGDTILSTKNTVLESIQGELHKAIATTHEICAIFFVVFTMAFSVYMGIKFS